MEAGTALLSAGNRYRHEAARNASSLIDRRRTSVMPGRRRLPRLWLAGHAVQRHEQAVWPDGSEAGYCVFRAGGLDLVIEAVPDDAPAEDRALVVCEGSADACRRAQARAGFQKKRGRESSL